MVSRSPVILNIAGGDNVGHLEARCGSCWEMRGIALHTLFFSLSTSRCVKSF